MVISNKTTMKLSSGFDIPAFAGYDDSRAAEVEAAVKFALQIGCRHLDCAAVYFNESAVGRGIKASGVPRKEISVTSKLYNTEHEPEDVGPAMDQTLKDLDLDYVDLYLIHWPQAHVKPEVEDENGDPILKEVPLISTWAAMEELVISGKARSIGVSNFSKSQIEEILSTVKIPPAVNQIQAHPYLAKKEFLEWCLSKNIHVTAWAPLSTFRAKKENVEGDPPSVEMAKSLKITPSQLALSWGIQRGTSVIPKSGHEERIRSNFQIFELPGEIMARVDNLGT